MMLFTSIKANEMDTNIIPRPVSLDIHKGSFELNDKTAIYVSKEHTDLQNIADHFSKVISYGSAITLKQVHVKPSDNFLWFSIDPDEKLGDEGYTLNITDEQIKLTANAPSGVFYGIQSLLQLLPSSIFETNEEAFLSIPCVRIVDYPRFSYRGMHLDVSRHFFPKEFIKDFIDLISMYKMNRFHWHLTDDNGWRIEIKKYPKLQEVAAWHVDRSDQHWTKVTPPKPGEKSTVGGYYTQEEIKEVVAYAQERYITIIPEIELPGHTSEVLAAYPELSCTGGPFYVQPGTYWPNVDIFCAGNEKVFEFLEDVFDEVISLFPSEFIHIGGDEADKTHWRKCPKCQRRISDENLKDEHELQSYFIKRIETYLNAKEKQIIGWDEILEGGLAPGATVMSWRGVQGGIEATKLKHNVIMTPTTHCYFDYYQANPEFQPDAIGGFLTLKKVYSFDPIPEELSKEEEKYILGCQGNVWTEYIPTPEHAQYMAVPRMLAIAETDWTPENKKDWDQFLRRVNHHYKRFDVMGVNYCEGSYQVDIETSTNSEGETYIILQSEIYNPDICFTLDGSNPTLKSDRYENPIEITGDVTVKAAVFKDGLLMEKPSVKKITVHKALRADITFAHSYSERYPGNGPSTLINGIAGSDNFHDGQWLGFHSKDLVAVIDLQTPKDVQQLRMRFLENVGSWIFLPSRIEVSCSMDGQVYQSIGRIHNEDPAEGSENRIKEYTFHFTETSAQYITIYAENIKTCPDWHVGNGDKAWVFIDEIIVE